MTNVLALADRAAVRPAAGGHPLARPRTGGAADRARPRGQLRRLPHPGARRARPPRRRGPRAARRPRLDRLADRPGRDRCTRRAARGCGGGGRAAGRAACDGCRHRRGCRAARGRPPGRAEPRHAAVGRPRSAVPAPPPAARRAPSRAAGSAGQRRGAGRAGRRRLPRAARPALGQPRHGRHRARRHDPPRPHPLARGAHPRRPRPGLAGAPRGARRARGPRRRHRRPAADRPHPRHQRPPARRARRRHPPPARPRPGHRAGCPAPRPAADRLPVPPRRPQSSNCRPVRTIASRRTGRNCPHRQQLPASRPATARPPRSPAPSRHPPPRTPEPARSPPSPRSPDDPARAHPIPTSSRRPTQAQPRVAVLLTGGTIGSGGHDAQDRLDYVDLAKVLTDEEALPLYTFPDDITVYTRRFSRIRSNDASADFWLRLRQAHPRHHRRRPGCRRHRRRPRHRHPRGDRLLPAPHRAHRAFPSSSSAPSARPPRWTRMPSSTWPTPCASPPPPPRSGTGARGHGRRDPLRPRRHEDRQPPAEHLQGPRPRPARRHRPVRPGLVLPQAAAPAHHRQPLRHRAARLRHPAAPGRHRHHVLRRRRARPHGGPRPRRPRRGRRARCRRA